MTQALSLLGSLVIAIGVFLPALTFRQELNVSLWDAHRVTGCALLVCVAISIYATGAKKSKWLVIVAIAAAVVTTTQLAWDIHEISSALLENAEFAKREAGWAGLFGLSIPKVNWWGWGVIGLGVAAVLINGITGMRTQFPIAETGKQT